MRLSKVHTSHQQNEEAPSQYYQTREPYRSFASSFSCWSLLFIFPTLLVQLEVQRRSPHSSDYTMAQPAAEPKGLAFFSAQTAFYRSAHEQSPVSPAVPGMKYLENNPLLSAGLSAVRQRLQNFTGKSTIFPPNQVEKSIKSIRHYFAVDSNYVLTKLLLLLYPFRSRVHLRRFCIEEKHFSHLELGSFLRFWRTCASTSRCQCTGLLHSL